MDDADAPPAMGSHNDRPAGRILAQIAGTNYRVSTALALVG